MGETPGHKTRRRKLMLGTLANQDSVMTFLARDRSDYTGHATFITNLTKETVRGIKKSSYIGYLAAIIWYCFT